jgi:DNA-binding transcriptional LysR family regulator
MGPPRLETFDLNLLRVFDALLQHCSVAAAADEMGVTSSAISHSLARLRQIFNDELFVKGPDGMAPTPRAAEFADRIAAVITQVRAILAQSEFKPALANRHFKLRCNNFIAWLLLPYVVGRLRADGLETTLTVQSDDSRSVADELDTGMVDLVIGTFGHLPERFESEVLLTDHWTWVIRSDHPALEGGLTADKLLELPKLVLASSGVGRSIDGIVSEAGLERLAVADKDFLSNLTAKSRYGTQVNGTLIMNSALAAPAIVARSDLVALIPARLATSMMGRYDLTMIEYERENRSFEHRLLWHRKHGANPAVEWLRQVFHSAVQEFQAKPEAESRIAV